MQATLRASFLPALLVGAFAGPARADLLVVDASGGADFTQIQTAVSAAFDGDTILVRGGQYFSFLVEDKELRILAQDGAAVETGTIRVRNLSAGKSLILAGLRSSGSASTSAASGHAVLLLDNDGAVRLQDCQVFGGPGFYASVDGWAAVRAESCLDVMLVGCFAQGGAGRNLQALDPPPGAGGAGLEASSSQVAVLGSEVIGGEGGWIVSGFGDVGGPGGAGAEVQGSYLSSSRSSLTGGIGGDCSGGSWGCGGDGGHGLVLDSTQIGADLHATSLAGGAGGPGCGPGRCPGADGDQLVDPASISTILIGPEHGLQLPDYATEDLGASIELTGTPGDQVFLFASDRAAFHPVPQWRGVLGLDRSGPFYMPLQIGSPPLEKRGSLLGVIPPSGSLQLVLPVAALPAGLPVADVFLQTVAVGFAGVTLSEPRSLSVFSCYLPRLDCDQDGISDLCELAAGAPDINGNGIPDACEPVRLYVRADALPGGDGSSWSNAMDDLDDALYLARISAGLVEEIWVAEGRYAPPFWGDGFELFTGISLYGGFAGDEQQLSQRELSAHPTTLSGDIAGDDLPGFLNREDNKRTVIKAEWEHPGGTFDVRVDGFVISGGNGANNGWLGAGFLLGAHDSVVANCRFTDNSTDAKGAGLGVGGVGNTVVNCRFEGNRAQAYWDARGGGMYTSAADLTVVNCVFTGNRARLGGGMYIEPSAWPGARPAIVDCTFSNNVASEGGGGIYSAGNALQPLFQLTNSILWGNRVGLGEPTPEEQQLLQPDCSEWAVSYSCIEGLGAITGTGNIGLDPSFALPKGADGQAGTADDDLHLRPASPCVDAGRNPALPPDHADLNLNGDLDEQTPLDIELLDRTVDDPDVPDTGSGQGALVDMGAHERQ